MHNHNNWYEIYTCKDESEFELHLSQSLSFPGIETEISIKNKLQFKYFLHYLNRDPDGLHARTILVEKNYTSASYLSDYINYYVNCSVAYIKNCRRVHFFSANFDYNKFSELLEMNKLDSHSEDNIWHSYLGYIVVRPLPKGAIGATLLKTYSEKAKRYYTAVRDYEINLFGKKLTITSMPFQEQDGVVSSCAASCLWFAFQKTSQLFNSTSLSPSEITISAGFDKFNTARQIPTQGLDIDQICDAVYVAGLTSQIVVSKKFCNDSKWLRAFIYSYLKMGIPIIMGVELEGSKQLHTTTLNGYRFSNDLQTLPMKSSSIGLSLVSDQINKLYGHDDQTGPFSKFEFSAEQSDFQFVTSIWKSVQSDETVDANCINLVVPILKQIKVTFNDVLDEITRFKSNLEIFFPNFNALSFIWDIYILESNKYKEELREDLKVCGNSYDPESSHILLESLPKYIWIARSYIDELLVFELIYDAFDVNFRNTPIFATVFNSSFKQVIFSHEQFTNFDNSFKNLVKSISQYEFAGDRLVNEIESYVSEIDIESIDSIESVGQKITDQHALALRESIKEMIKKGLRNDQ